MRDNGVASGLAAMRELPDRSVGACYRAAVAAEVSGDRTRALAWLEDAMNRGYAPRNRECVLVASFELALEVAQVLAPLYGREVPRQSGMDRKAEHESEDWAAIAMVVVYS